MGTFGTVRELIDDDSYCMNILKKSKWAKSKVAKPCRFIYYSLAIFCVISEVCKCKTHYLQEDENVPNETERSPSPVTRTVEHRNSILSEVSGTDTPTFQNYAFQSTENL